MKTLTLGMAIAIAAEAHKNQPDKAGRPYILHVLWVMNEVMKEYPGDDELASCAVLHDLIEDTDWFLEDSKDFREEIRNGYDKDFYTIAHPKHGPIEITKRQYYCIQALTHIGDSRSDSYYEYINSMLDKSDAMKIKLKDLEHNTKITRMIGTSQKDIDRLEKYFKTYKLIKDKLIKIGEMKC